MASTGPRRGPATRPKGRGPAARPRPETEAPAEVAQWRSTVTVGRVIGALTVALMLLLLLGPTLKTYVDQRGEIAALQEHVAKQRADVAAMEKEKALWSDPAYVEQQARQRLKFVKVGEKAYSLIDADAVPTSKAADPVLDAATASTHPWYGQLWESVKTSDNPQRSAG
ncbi:MAG: septum formation initiator family protein [Dermatophilaceae bacterium]